MNRPTPIATLDEYRERLFEVTSEIETLLPRLQSLSEIPTAPELNANEKLKALRDTWVKAGLIDSFLSPPRERTERLRTQITKVSDCLAWDFAKVYDRLSAAIVEAGLEGGQHPDLVFTRDFSDVVMI